jgi:SNF2 family DNA or RNA helicase
MPFRFMGPDMVHEASFWEFRQRHFYTVDPEQHIWLPSPDTHTHVQGLIGNASLCFKKEECLDLPPKIYQSYKCALSRAQQEEYDRTKDEMMFIIKKQCQECDKNGTKCDWVCNSAILIKNALVKITKLAQITCGFFIETKFEITPEGKKIDKSVVHWFDENPKLDMLISNISTIPSNRKIIIWSHFTAGIKMLVERIKKAFGEESYIAVYGDVNAFDAVNKFRDNPKIRFFIANQRKAGTGLNIQFSNYQMVFSQNHSLIQRQQFEDRQHRQGQKDTVTIMDFLCHKTIDEEILNVVTVEKKEMDNSLNSLARMGGFNLKKNN